MIQVLVFFLALLLSVSPSLSQRSSGRMDLRPPRNNNTWLIYGIVFNHRVSPARLGPNTPLNADKHPPLWAQFTLLRSRNCDSYKEAAVGEGQLSEDTKSRLKWRMMDYKTSKNNDSPFESITFQIVNTLNPARYCALELCKTAYSHVLKILTIRHPQRS
jgi:hypothetical protein